MLLFGALRVCILLWTLVVPRTEYNCVRYVRGGVSDITVSNGVNLVDPFIVEIQCFVCDRATPPLIEKLRSKGVAMRAYGVSAYYRYPEIN